MELVKVVIEKVCRGHKFTNTWCVINGGGSVVPTTPATIEGVAFGIPVVAGWEVWNPDDGDYPAEPTPLQAIVALEVALRPDIVTITKAIVSDGKKNTTEFLPISINQPGIAAVPSGDLSGIAPGNIIWQIVKQPNGVNSHYGHFQCRLSLNDQDIIVNGMDMLDWTSSANALAHALVLEGRISDAHLDRFMSFGAVADPNFKLAIPHIGSPSSQNPGSWINATPIANLISSVPKGRQVHRGKKRNP